MSEDRISYAGYFCKRIPFPPYYEIRNYYGRQILLEDIKNHIAKEELTSWLMNNSVLRDERMYNKEVQEHVKKIRRQELWDGRMMEVAKLVSSWSKDPSTRVGSVIADSDYRIVSTGFNGFDRSHPDDSASYEDREIKYAQVIHAEENAILFAKKDLTNHTMFVSVCPCARCAAKIVQVGISRVVVLPTGTELMKRIKGNMAKEILKRGGVELMVHGVSEPYNLRKYLDEENYIGM